MALTLLVAADLLAKSLALAPSGPVVLPGGVVQLSLVLNGAPLGGHGPSWALLSPLMLAVATVVALAYVRYEWPGRLGAGLLLISAGGFANGYDRLLDGSVVDFLGPFRFGSTTVPMVANLADVYLAIGGAIVFRAAYALWRGTLALPLPAGAPVRSSERAHQARTPNPSSPRTSQ